MFQHFSTHFLQQFGTFSSIHSLHFLQSVQNPPLHPQSTINSPLSVHFLQNFFLKNGVGCGCIPCWEGTNGKYPKFVTCLLVSVVFSGSSDRFGPQFTKIVTESSLTRQHLNQLTFTNGKSSIAAVF